MNYAGLDTIGVGNHEFDEGSGRAAADAVRQPERTTAAGRTQAPRTRPSAADGCHPVDGCQDGTPFGGSRLPVPRGERDRHGHATTRSCRRTRSSTPRRARRSPSSARRSRARRSIVTPTGVAGLELPRRGRHGQRARPAAEEEERRADRAAPARGRHPERAVLARLHGRQHVRELHRRPTSLDVVNRLDDGGRRGRQRAHAPAVHLHHRRPARHRGGLVRPSDHVDRPDDRPARPTTIVSATAEQQRRHADGGRRMRVRPRSSRATRRSPIRSGTASSARSRRTSTRRAARSTGPTPPASSRWAT